MGQCNIRTNISGRLDLVSSRKRIGTLVWVPDSPNTIVAPTASDPGRPVFIPRSMMFMKTTSPAFVEVGRGGGLTMELLRRSCCSRCQYEQDCQCKGQQAEFSGFTQHMPSNFWMPLLDVPLHLRNRLQKRVAYFRAARTA